MTTEVLAFYILPGAEGSPPHIRSNVLVWDIDGETTRNVSQVASELTANTDTAMVARAMLQAAAYLFAQGQPVQFGAEIPREVLR